MNILTFKSKFFKYQTRISCMVNTNLFIIAFLLFISFPFIGGCQEKPEQPEVSTDSSQVLSRANVHTETIDGVEVKTIYYDDKSKTETQYRNGVRNGWTKNIDESGKVTSEGTYLNDKMEGEFRSYYPNGKLMLKANYKAGLLDGSSYYYFPDGKIQKETKYERNKILFIKEYDQDGNLLYEDKF